MKEIKCNRCNRTDIQFKKISSKKMKKLDMTHIGVYSIHCNKWIKWISKEDLLIWQINKDMENIH
jgi:hypothetical protein